MSCQQSEPCGGKHGEETFLLVAELSLMLDLRAELGTGESLRPLASDLAREEDEDRREAEQGGSTCQESMCFIKVKALLGGFFSHKLSMLTVRDPRLAPTPPTLGPILHSASGRCVGETTFGLVILIFLFDNPDFDNNDHLHRRLHIFQSPHILNAYL